MQSYDRNLTLEINPNHELVVKLSKIRKSDVKLASLIARQLLDNTLIQTGNMQDPKLFIQRINKLMKLLLDQGLDAAKVEDSVYTNEAQRKEVSDDDEQSVLKKSKKFTVPEPENNFDSEIVIDENGNPKVVNKNKKN